MFIIEKQGQESQLSSCLLLTMITVLLNKRNKSLNRTVSKTLNVFAHKYFGMAHFTLLNCCFVES